MNLSKAITIASRWLGRMPSGMEGDASASAAQLRALADAARRAIPSIDVRATRDAAKRGLRAVAAIERHAASIESRSVSIDER